MRKSEINEINEFFNSLGIDNEMLSQMASSYTENFMIQGEETKTGRNLKTGSGIPTGLDSGKLAGRSRCRGFL